MKRTLLFLVITLIFISCNNDMVDLAKETESMKQADISFSDLSEQKGMKSAFLQYLDSSGVLLRPDHYPIVGKDAKQFFQHINDSAFTLTWVPEHASVAKSGELGYTSAFIPIPMRIPHFRIRFYLEKTSRWQLEICTGFGQFRS